MENSSPNPSFSICDFQIQKGISRGFAKSFPQKIVFAKPSPHCSATCLNTWKAEHQRKMSFPFSRKISPQLHQESKEHFSLVLPSEARQWRNDSFSIRILLEKSSDFVQETQQSFGIRIFAKNRSVAKRHLSSS